MLKLAEDFKELVTNKNELEFACEYILSELIDEAILSIVFENHYLLKHKVNT